MLRTFWQRITASRRMRALEAAAHAERELRCEIARLRAENRALLNSILGIAGIPPIVVSETEAATEADMLNIFPPSSTSDGTEPSRSVPVNLTGTNLNLPLCADGESQPRPGERHRDATNLTESAAAPPRPDKPESQAPSRGSFGRLPARRLPAAAGRPAIAGRPSTAGRPSAAGGASQRNVSAPRRRSWQQINRMLELQSARKPSQET